MPERLECEVLQKAREINTLTFTYLPSRALESAGHSVVTCPSIGGHITCDTTSGEKVR